jgi:hypothetical protein
MADNVAITAGSGTSIAADDIASVWYQRNKLSLGADGTAVDAVAGAGVVGTGVQRVTLASDDPAVVDLAAIEVLATAGNASLVSIDGKITAVNTGAVVLAAGTAAFGKLAANSGVDIGDVDVVALTGSTIAHDAVDSGSPHKIGAVATASLNGGTNVAAADRTDLKATVDGALLVREGSLEDIATATPIAITDGSSTSLIAAQGAGVKVYITDITICNTSASNVTVDLRDGAAGSVKWTFPVPAGGGVTHSFRSPIPFTANTAVCADPSASASTITVSANGFKSKI